VNGFKHDKKWESVIKEKKPSPGLEEKYINETFEVQFSTDNFWIGPNKYCLLLSAKK
jgi:hypothetical protein